MDIEMGDGDGIPTPQSGPSLADGNLLPSTSLSPKAQASLQSCRAETDFDSYHAFLVFHKSQDTELGVLDESLGRCTNPIDFRTPSDLGSRVLNISKDCDISFSPPHSEVHQTNIIEALCDPPEDAQLQIVIWSLSCVDHMMAQRDLIDFLGLHFSLDPRCLSAVRALIQRLERGGYGILVDVPLDRHNPTHAKIDNAIITFCLPGDGTDGIPIVLIAQYAGYDSPVKEQSLEEQSLENGERKQLHPRPPLSRSDSWYSQLASLQGLGSYRYYPQMLTRLLESPKTTTDDFSNLLLICFLPCLQLQLGRIRSSCNRTRYGFEDHFRSSIRGDPDDLTETLEDTLYTDRTVLRSDISDVEDQWSAVIRYMKMRLSRDPSKGLLFHDFEEEIAHVIGESNRLESQIRDYLQLRAGTLGLEESRRSIDLSNRQIEEAKRVKICKTASTSLPASL
ncbi:MAG: hypothetical protein Q9208_006362 [Pyrenodesmia sp. 3 TL-2023]